MCQRLEAQLATVDRGGAATRRRPSKSAATRKPPSKQQGELDRVTAQAKRQGCDSSGFFSLFTGQSAQCGPVNTQIQQMRGNLDQITTSLERLRAGSGFGNPDRDNQRRSVLLALAQNNCGPQYANAAQGGGNFLDNLFGNNNSPAAVPSDLGPQSGTFRTVCARTCDGAYFPISFATVPSRFPDDEKTCKSLCPATEATLFAYRNPGEDMNQAVSINGQPYSATAECIPLPDRIRSVLRLQGRRANLVGRAEIDRRQGRRRTAGRHHRHRGEREENGAAAVEDGAGRRQEEGRRTRDDGHRAASRGWRRRPRRLHPTRAGKRQADPLGRADLHSRALIRHSGALRAKARPGMSATPRTLPPSRGPRATPVSRPVQAAACRNRETCW